MDIHKALKQQIGDLLEEYHKLKPQQYDKKFLLTYATVELMIHELRKTLEEREDYEDN